jgi:hypothetical protein
MKRHALILLSIVAVVAGAAYWFAPAGGIDPGGGAR